MEDLLKIEPLDTNKSKIKTTKNMDDGVIPRHPVSCMFVGKSGSGKTVLLLNLLTKKQFFKDFFDIMFLFSETAGFGGDDLYKHLDIPDDHIFKPNKQGVEQLNHIVKTQKKLIKDKSIEKSPKILIIFDDIAHSTKFLKSDAYLLLHIANRHLNISCFSLVQSYVRIPRSCRCNIGCIFFFHGCTESEKEKLSEEHCPANFKWKEFLQVINHATDEKHSFMFVNKSVNMKQRYRKRLDTILELQK